MTWHGIASPTALACALTVLFGAARAIDAQLPDTSRAPSGPSHVLRTRDGSLFLGRLLAESADSVHFLTIGGEIAVVRSDVVELRPLPARLVRQGQYWAPDPNDTRLFFAPTGRMLAKGDGYFSDTDLLLLNFVGGVTPRFTMGGGFSIIPSQNPQNNVIYITPKFGVIQSERINVAVGALVGFAGFEEMTEDDWERNFGIVYGVSTFGTPEGSFTVGSGLAYTGNGFVDRPVVMLGGSRRAGRRYSLVTENYIFPSSDNRALITYGVRLLGEKLSVDLAWANFVARESQFLFPGFPYIAVAMKF